MHSNSRSTAWEWSVKLVGVCYRRIDRREVQRARDGNASWLSQYAHGPLLAPLACVHGARLRRRDCCLSAISSVLNQLFGRGVLYAARYLSLDILYQSARCEPARQELRGHGKP
jgi:hypothetical protein